jgi:L-amino acid N-acyltransferase YncA
VSGALETRAAAPVIRLATAADASSCLAIYAPIVEQTAISFETEVPSVDEMERRITEKLVRFPWLVCAGSEGILGYAYGGPHRPRSAYQWSVEVSAYVAAAARGRGVGRRLYTSLLALLRLQGFANAFAGIALPNAASVGLHEAMGFQAIGVYRNIGYKLGRWQDVGWWQRQLRELPAEPAPPLPLAEARELPGWSAALPSANGR